ncbi:hypothetical protein [Rhodococcus sp. UNC23MFCrub1.1]|uniref:hypothetical protein n=1 Tax=Rhodococcus sp. UNC23MFCrub1.1 TaxID=1449068 RepID=UPI0012DBCD61|nr:hypothetical protein [Rhodococcus sp. UNC23MFCrub1.1]
MATPVDQNRDSTTPGVSSAAVDDAVRVLHDRLDVMLDRLTDSVMGAPTPGSASWRTRYGTPGALTTAVRAQDRTAVRAMIAARAGVVDPAAPAPVRHRPTSGAVSPRRRRPRPDPAQLSMF